MKYESTSTNEFYNWLDNLKDTKVKIKVNVRISRAKAGNFGDWKTEAGEVRALCALITVQDIVFIMLLGVIN